MLKKAINHVIQAKRKDKKLDEALKKVRRVNVIVTSANSFCCTFLFQFKMRIWRSSWTPIETILVSLEISGCLVFIKLKKLKIGRAHV